jgi:propionyl-CoA carboxylase alpha chain
MRDALDAFHIRGLNHNIGFLAALVAKPRFVEGRLSTNFIAEEYPSGFGGAEVPEAELKALAAIAAIVHQRIADRDHRISGQLRGPPPADSADWVVLSGEAADPVRVSRAAGHHAGYVVETSGHRQTILSDWQPWEPLFRGTVDGHALVLQVERAGTAYRLFRGGAAAEFRVLTSRQAQLWRMMPVKAAADMSRFLLSPMPGLLVSVAVEIGQEVKAGEELAVVEAMKMENVLRAERDGKVAKIHAAAGDSLAVDQAILEFA